MNTHICSGCKAGCLGEWFLDYQDRKYECPCISCLVKVTCMDICEKYHKFQKLRDIKRGSLWPPSRFVKDEKTLLIKYWNK